MRILRNSLSEGRVHHAFLFSGTRGVGKTTIARILAKSLNCQNGVSAEPCGECAHCVAIDEGRFVDLLEIDAASRTRVDDTREILDNVQYAPSAGRYKVYLIDEVHMLSGHSFNALLKTLEEPPEHVKFVLATTDPQKIPVTILSRCLQFHLRRLSPDQIGEQIERIVASEHIDAEAEAVALLARAADGSMRDGLSLLDQALAGGAQLTLANVQDMLGSVEQDHVYALLDALAQRDTGAALAVLNEVFSLARDAAVLLQDLAEALHRIAMIERLPDYRDDSRADWERLSKLTGRFDPEDVQLFYQIAITGRRDLELAPNERIGCEMTVLRMLAFAPAAADDCPPASGSEPVGATRSAGPDASVMPSGVAEAGSSSNVRWRSDHGLDSASWPHLIERLGLAGPVRSVAGLLAIRRLAEPLIEFGAHSQDMVLMTERFRGDLQRSLSHWLTGPVTIRIQPLDRPVEDTPASLEQQRAMQTQAEAEAAIDQDPMVRKLCRRFGAEVVRESIRPRTTRSH